MTILLLGMTIINQCFLISYLPNGPSAYTTQVWRYNFPNIITKGTMANGTTTYFNLNGISGTHYYYVKSGNIVTVSFNVKCSQAASS